MQILTEQLLLHIQSASKMSDPTMACNVQKTISGVLASIEPIPLKFHLLQ